MKNALWFLVGVIAGLAAGHLVSKDPRGHEVLADIDARISEFTDRVTDAYRSQEARFGGVLDDAKDAAADALDAARNVASDAAEAAKRTTATAAEAAKQTASGAVDAASDAAKKLTD